MACFWTKRFIPLRKREKENNVMVQSHIPRTPYKSKGQQQITNVNTLKKTTIANIHIFFDDINIEIKQMMLLNKRLKSKY
jgi:hypothetical protein